MRPEITMACASTELLSTQVQQHKPCDVLSVDFLTEMPLIADRHSMRPEITMACASTELLSTQVQQHKPCDVLSVDFLTEMPLIADRHSMRPEITWPMLLKAWRQAGLPGGCWTCAGNR